MTGFEPAGRLLIVLGFALVILGVALAFGSRIPLLGRLPGDLRFDFGGVSVYAPVATMVVLSVLLTIVANLFFRR